MNHAYKAGLALGRVDGAEWARENGPTYAEGAYNGSDIDESGLREDALAALRVAVQHDPRNYAHLDRDDVVEGYIVGFKNAAAP